MEAVVVGQPGHYPTDDIEIDALTLIRMVGGHTENLYTEGKSTTISYKPYPEDFGDFRDANIMLANLKSEYKPFTIARPYGVRVQPYMPSGPVENIFIIWGKPPEKGYVTPFGHFLNYWHYRRTDTTLEQIYLHGMINAEDPVKELVSLGWSWIHEPVLSIEGWKADYTYFTYDPAQKAYIVPRKGRGPIELTWSLVEPGEGPMHIINPTFIVKDWDTGPLKLEVDGKTVEPGKNFRIGYEETPTGHDLVLWLKMTSTKPSKFSITPASE
jgi:hypothetical protein